VPLSEHEQRLLEQMERAMYAEDPKFATTMRGNDPRGHHRRRAAIGVVGFLVGVVLLFTGLVLTTVPVSVAGFVVMLASAVFAISSWRQMPASSEGTPKSPGQPPAAGSKSPRKSRQRGRMMDRIEERWRRRREQGGR
jgi:Protein of unknown function (DUF3040)